MPKTVEVKLGEYRSVGFFEAGELALKRDEYIILEVERGHEYGKVVSDPRNVCAGKEEKPQGHILRLAAPEDIHKIEENRKKAKEALAVCIKKVEESKVDMQIVQCEYSFDNTKIIFFFTSEGRVDFRDLVKDLAKTFKVRIELKQIGVRDKAKIIGGVGVCGRELCCSSYMKDFHPLSVKMSKEQNLPLNPSRISGVCGRIKCCMAYEYMVYKEYARDLPRAGEKINTPEGKGKVIEVNILKRYVRVDVGEGKITKVPFASKRDS